MSMMPTLGQPPKKSPLPKVLVIAILAGGLTGGVFYWRNHSAQVAEQARLEADAQAAAAAEQVRIEAEKNRPKTPEEQLAESGLKLATTEISGPLETAVVSAVGSQVGPALTQVVTRTLVWWVEVPGDLRRGDRLDVLYEERAGQEPQVHAVRFVSGKAGRTFEAFLFKPQDDKYARFFEPSGEELEQRLVDSPIDDYEQVTSLLRDGRRHKGVDFKAPEGTPVKAPFDGTITRRNWNFRVNGNALALRDASGRREAIFLHLDALPSDIRVGMRVKKGQAIAKSGNTGRSFAPHLHYQLMGANGSKVLDPFVEHATWRKKLPEADRAAFDAAMANFQALLSPAAVAGAAP